MSRENNKIWNGLLKFQRTIMVITAVVVTVIVSLSMLMRVFDKDLVGYEEILVMVAFWLYMIGSSYGTYEKSQITADILNIYLKEGKVKSAVNLFRSLLTLTIGLIFNFWALQFLTWALKMSVKTPVWRLPMAIGQGSIFVGLTLMSFYHIVFFYDEIKIFKLAMTKGATKI